MKILKTFEEVKAYVAETEKLYNNTGIELENLFNKKTYLLFNSSSRQFSSAKIKEYYMDWCKNKTFFGNHIELFSFVKNYFDYLFIFTINLYQPNYEVKSKFRIDKDISNNLNFLIKDFGDLNVKFDSGTGNCDINLDNEPKLTENKINSPEELKFYINRFKELIIHMEKFLKNNNDLTVSKLDQIEAMKKKVLI